MTTPNYYADAYNKAISRGESDECAIVYAEIYKRFMLHHEAEEAQYEEKESEEEFLEASNNAYSIADDSLSIYKECIENHHSIAFSRIVCAAAEYRDGLLEAYQSMSKEEAWQEAYLASKQKGKSELYCNRIANRIKNWLIGEDDIDLLEIEQEVDNYERAYTKIINEGRDPQLADYYADLNTYNGGIYVERFAYGLLLMKEILIAANHNEKYIDLFINNLCDSKVSYDELDKSTFFPNARDFWHICQTYGFTDAYLLARSNKTSEENVVSLQNIAIQLYFDKKDMSLENRNLLMQKAVEKYNDRNKESPISFCGLNELVGV